MTKIDYNIFFMSLHQLIRNKQEAKFCPHLADENGFASIVLTSSTLSLLDQRHLGVKSVVNN